MVRNVITPDINVFEADPRVAVTRAEMSGPNAVEAIIGLTGEMVEGVQKGRALKGVQEDVERFATVAEAQRRGFTVNPTTGALQGSGVTEEGDVPAAELEAKLRQLQSQSATKFEEISRIMEQKGTYAASMAARLHTEKTIRDLASQTPGFEREIRQTAASVLGYDPMGFGMQQILDVAAPKSGPQTAWEKFVDEARAYTLQWNFAHPDNQIDLEEGIRRLSMTEVMSRQNEFYEQSKQNGVVSAEQVLTHYNANAGLDKTVSKIFERSAGGQLFNYKDANQTRNAIRIIKQEEFAQMVADARRNPNFRMTEDIASQFQAAIDRKWALPSQMVEDNTIFKVVTDRIEQYGVLAEDKMYQLMPGLMMLRGAGSEALVAKMADIFFSVGGEQQARVWLQNFPELRSALKDTESPMQTINNAARYLFGFDGFDINTLPAEERPEVERASTALASTLYAGAGTKAERSEIVTKIGESKPRYQLSLIAADPKSFDMLDEATRKEVAANQVREAYNLVSTISDNLYTPDFFNKNPSSNTRLSVDPETGELRLESFRQISPSREGRWVVVGEAPGTSVPKEIQAYNNIHRRIYSDPKWREYILGPNVTTAAQASNLIVLGVEERRLRALLDRAREREQEMMSSYDTGGTGLTDEQVAEMNSRIQPMREAISRYEDQLSLIQTRILGFKKGSAQ